MWKDWEKDQLLNYCWLKMRSIRKRLNQKYQKKKKNARNLCSTSRGHTKNSLAKKKKITSVMKCLNICSTF